MTTTSKIESTFKGDYEVIPQLIRDGLVRYVTQFQRPGGFLEAVLSNDLKETFARADNESRAALFEIVSWLYNIAPGGCWGSPQRVKEWLQYKGWGETEAKA